MTKGIQILFILLLLTSVAKAQAPNYQITQYTLEDGLPSNECHAAVQDSLGYIWIATDRGLSRFDGYGFKNYGIKEGLEDVSCLQMQIDSHNDLWVRTYSDAFYKYSSRLDTIITYPFNNKIKNIRVGSLRNDILEFYISSEDTLYVSIGNIGLIKLDKKGKLIKCGPKLNRNVNSFFSIESRVIVFANSSLKGLESNIISYDNGHEKYKATMKYGSNEIPLRYRKDQKKISFGTGFKFHDSKICHYNSGHIYLFSYMQLDTIIPSPAIKDLVELPSSGILTAELE